jgi:hypothetical protein
MRRCITLSVLAVAVSVPAMFAQQTAPVPGNSTGRIRTRQARQQQRIAEGIESGQLTPRETARLERKETRLNREIRRDRADGGGLSARERRKINRRQNQLSRQIYREKHDPQRVRQ